MPKWLKKTLLLLLSIILCGCSSTPDLNNTEYLYFTKKGLSCVKPSGVVEFPIYNDMGEDPVYGIVFQSYEELKNDVLSGNFTEKEMSQFRILSKGVGYFHFPFNVNEPPIPVFPESWNLEFSKVQIYGGEVQVIFQCGEIEKAVVCAFAYSYENTFSLRTKEYTNGGTDTFRKRILSEGKKTLYITESIRNSTRSSLSVFGRLDKVIVDLEFNNIDKWGVDLLNDDALLQISIQHLNLKS